MVRSPYRRQRRSRSSSSSGSSGDRGSKRLRQSPHANRRSSRDRATETGRRRSRSRDSSRRRSRSRDRSRRRSRSHDSSRRRSRSPDRGRRLSRSRESSRKRERSYSPPPVRPIISEDPKYLNARVFVGHLASDRVTKEELESHFKIYGNILDCYVHPKGYGFVQFINEDEARIAAAKENRSLLKGSRIDTRMAAEGRRDRAPNRERDPRDRDYPPRDFREGLRDDMRDPYRDPMRDPMLDPMRDPIRDQDPLRDPIRDPTREPLRDPMRDPLRDPRDAYDMSRGLPPRERSPLRDPYDGPPRSRLPPRDRSPGRDLPPGEGPPRDRFDLRGLPPPPREGSPLRDPYDDRFRDPYRGPRDPGRPPRDARDPYYNDPYRPPPAHDPYFDRFDTYRRDPFIDPYRDPYFPPPKLPPPPPPECVIVLMNNQLREYGERIERQIKALKVLTEVIVIPEGKPLIKQIEEISLQKGLYAIVLNSENQKHESLTLNVLFGKAQEHRNMPADCGVELIKKTFEKYLGSLKEKAAAPLNPGPPPPNPGPSGPPGNFTKPSKELSYLLHLLADSHHLTLGELDQVILYLKDRRDQELSPDSRPLGGAPGRIGPGLEKSLNAQGLIPTQLPPDPHQLPLRDSPHHLQTMRESPQGLRESPRQQLQLQESPKLQTQELQNNILGMLNGMNSGGVRQTPTSVPEPGRISFGGAGDVGAMGGGMFPLTVSPKAPPVISPHVTPTSQSAAPTPISAAAINTALLNFDNPNVMMALDNLIQSGPNLLRNISAATSSAQPGPPGTTNQ